MRAPVTVMGQKGRCTLCGRSFVATAENTAPAPLLEARLQTIPEAPARERKAPRAVPEPVRIEALDQLRGYAILGMFLVNYLGNFAAMPWILEHQHGTFSYADTIAPLFVFVVGMGFRLSLKRRAERSGLADARIHSLKRYLVLFVVAIAFYGPDYRLEWWDALTEIALAGLLTLPLIDKPVPVRAVAAVGYLGVFTYAFFGMGYGEWLYHESMNGGPLGPLGASFMLLFGTIAYDLLDSDDTGRIVKGSLAFGLGLIALAVVAWVLIPKAYGSYAELGSYWSFAKRWGAPPFVLLATGIAFLTFLLFYWVVELKDFSFSHLSLFGENPLVIYLVQYSLLENNGIYLPERFAKATGLGTAVIALGCFAIFYGFMYAIAWRLHKDKIIIKL
jgi:predicted acyltransferase